MWLDLIPVHVFKEPLVKQILNARGGLVALPLSIGLSLVLAGCSMLENDRVDYKSAGKAPSLEIPPDLTQLSRETRYNVPGAAVTASGYEAGKSVSAVPTAATGVADVRIERAGNQRWLVVDRPADKLWDGVRDFWQESGFLLTLDQAELGIMETDWAENRAKIPDDFIRRSLGKLLDSVYSTGERDKFRTRLERNAAGGTEIYISHRGMVETYTSNSKDQTVWVPRLADPELETEFLRRLMVRLGVSQEQSKVQLATGIKTTSKIATQNGQPVVIVDDGFERAWRRVGLSLDRTGFTVEDRDRAKGTYFVRYVEPNADKAEPGFFAKLFGGSAKVNAPLKYQITVKSQGESTTVAVLDAAGAPDTSANAERIVKVIADDLK
jgi:outer membrane protein assembly factor BamC